MKLQFLGTGAADFDWTKYGAPDIKGSTSTLLDDHILIDCGTTVSRALKRFNIPYSNVTHVVITHNHSDHFDIEVLKKIASANQLCLYGSKEVCQKAQSICKTVEVSYGKTFTIGKYTFTAIPSNHSVEDFLEQTFLYIIEDDQKKLLYALDTVNITANALNFIDTRCFDAIIWDTTCSDDSFSWMNFYHSNVVSFRKIRHDLTAIKRLRENSLVIFNHRARQFWPATEEETLAIAKSENAIAPNDGDIISI